MDIDSNTKNSTWIFIFCPTKFCTILPQIWVCYSTEHKYILYARTKTLRFEEKKKRKKWKWKKKQLCPGIKNSRMLKDIQIWANLVQDSQQKNSIRIHSSTIFYYRIDRSTDVLWLEHWPEIKLCIWKLRVEIQSLPELFYNHKTTYLWVFDYSHLRIYRVK